MRFPRITIFVLIASFLLQPLTPAMVQAAPDKVGDKRTKESDLSFDSLPPFPEDTKAPVIDWATVDWDELVSLPQDMNERNQKIAELEKAGQFDEIGKIKPRTRLMSDADVLAHYGAPQAVQDLVQAYLAVKPNIKTEAAQTYTRYQLAQNIRSELEAAGYYPADFERQPIEYNKAIEEKLPKVDLRTVKTSTFRGGQPLKSEKIKIQVPAGLSPVNAKIEVFRKPVAPPLKIKPPKVSFLPWLRSLLIDEALAYYQPAVPLITYFEGIEKQPIPNLLYQLSQTQNEDGSWGDYNRYQNTAEITLALSNMRLIDNNQYALAIAYLTNATAQNNREIAIKARLYADLSLPDQSFSALLAMEHNSDGGFGLRPGDASDVETTLEVLAAYAHIALVMPESAVVYVLGKIEANGQMRYSADGPVSYHLMNQTSRTLYWVTNNIEVATKRQLIVAELARQFGVEADLTASDDIDILQTLRILTLYNNHQLERDNLWAEAMARSTANSYSGSDLSAIIAALNALPQPDMAIISLRTLGSTVNGEAVSVELTVKNKGYARASGATLAVFANDYQIQDTITLSPTQLTLDPNGQKAVVIDFPADLSKRFLGDMELKFYLENSHDSSYANNWLAASYNFAPAPDGSPALPLYFGAIKSTGFSTPSVNMFWQQRTDANRLKYLFMYRVHGADAWNTTPLLLYTFAVSGFSEDTLYDITAGAQGTNGAVVYFPDIFQIKTASDDTKYKGSFNGQVTIDNNPAPDFDIIFCGVSATDEAGNFICPDVAHGTRAPYAGIDRSTYPYERLRRTVKVDMGAATAGVRLYTRLRPDTAAPVMVAMELRGASAGTVLHNQTVTLVAQSADNISPAEADFYYYDPTEAVWLYIGTNSTNESVSSSFDWTIPAITPGAGYRVGARMRDAGGNESNWLEWGPSFTISDGIDRDAPVVTDLQILFEMDKSFNNQRTVTVYAAGTDNMGIVEGVFEYWDPSQAQWLALAAPSLTNASLTYQWAVPTGIQGSGYKLRVKLRDAVGNESSWTEWGPFTVVSGTKPSGTVRVEGLVNNQWLLGETKNISWSISGANPIASIDTAWFYFTPTFASHVASNINLALSGKIYTMPLDASYTASGAYVLLNVCDTAYNCAQIKSDLFDVVDPSPPPPAPWQAPVPAHLVSNSPGVYRDGPRVFKRNDGLTAVIYYEVEGLASADPGQYRRIVYRALVDGVWQTPVKVAEYLYRSGLTADISYNNVRGIYDSAGALHITYTKNISTASADPDIWKYDLNARQVAYARISPAGALAEARLVSSGVISAGAAQVAFTGNDRAVVVYSGGHDYVADSGAQLFYFTEDLGNGSWSAPAAISSDQGGDYALTGENGAVVMVYAQWPGIIKSIKRPANGAWGAPVTILSTDTFYYDFSMFAKGGGVYDVFYRLYNSTAGKYSVNYLKFNLAADGVTANVLQQRQVTSLADSGNVQGFVALPSAYGYHVIYTHRPGDIVRAEYVFFNDRGTYLRTVVSPQLMNIDYGLDGFAQNDVVGVYFSGYVTGSSTLFFNTADMASAIANLPGSPPIAPPPSGAGNTAIQLSDYGPGQTATQSIRFVPVVAAAAPGSLLISWPSGFSLNSAAAPVDVTVAGGGVTWAEVLSNNINVSARTLTLNWTSGSLTPSLPVNIDIHSVKNPPADGQYNISVASGEDIHVVPVNISSSLASVSAVVPYPPSNPTVSNITPVETIIIENGQSQVITMALADVNNDPVTYTLTPSSGAISVNPDPPSPLTGTQDGRTITFSYLANGATGAQTITVTADDNEPVGGGVVVRDIQLFVL